MILIVQRVVAGTLCVHVSEGTVQRVGDTPDPKGSNATGGGEA